MKTTLGLLVLACAANVHAAQLTPYQQNALDKMLLNAPLEHRAAMRPQLEMTLANLSNQHIDMMLAGLEKRSAAAAQPAPLSSTSKQANAGNWSPAAQAAFDKAFTLAQGYISRVAEVRDTAGKADLCRSELNLLPVGRKQHAAMASVLAEQDRLTLRTMVEHRAMNKTAEQFAASLGTTVSNEMVQSLRHYFEAPMQEAEVIAKLGAIQAEAAKLADAHERERLQIANGTYADRGAGVFSRTEESKLAALDARTAKATRALCEPGLGYFQRGLAAFIDPAVVPKVRN